ncbi:LysR family transcriptional regulator [Marinomonas algarum]|uniref:LysR family transcriptional regulator n=1 Tax=Marinomonas algarum TaxID=2883105 RepID=A0A9X1RUD0_9GAMM|nr:LysR family transcriptional regulator [Marinomonas algarum]
MYDLNELRTFVSVMETGNLKESALKLGVSKSTLSRRVQHLEQVLNQPLLRRQANRLIANEAGTQFLPFAKKILYLADDGHRAVEALRDDVSGSLKVYVHTKLAYGWFSKRASAFVDRFSNVDIDVTVGCQALSDIEQYDLCIWLQEPIGAQIKSEALGALKQGLYASPHCAEQLIGITHPSDIDASLWVNLFNCEENGIALEHEILPSVFIEAPRPRLRMSQYEYHVDAILQGKGVGLLPHYFAQPHFTSNESDRLCPVLPGWEGEDSPIYLHYSFGCLSKKLQTFLQYLREEAKGLQ